MLEHVLEQIFVSFFFNFRYKLPSSTEVVLIVANPNKVMTVSSGADLNGAKEGGGLG